MAIGLSRIMGYRLPVNFRMPYVSLSIQEFWRRWHITLSNWLRDYLYIPLGGSRKGEVRTYVNNLLTMLIGGLWHGASWNFVFWGGLHGVALAINRAWNRPLLGGGKAGKFLGWLMTFVFVTLCWLPFRAKDFPTTWVYLKGMFGAGEGGAQWLYAPSLILLAVLAVWHVAFYFSRPWLKGKLVFQRLGSFVSIATMMALLFAVVMYAQVNQAPFIYFQF